MRLPEGLCLDANTASEAATQPLCAGKPYFKPCRWDAAMQWPRSSGPRALQM